VKKRAINKPDVTGKIQGGGSGSHVGHPRFDFDLIKDDVDEGRRHTALVGYTGHLIRRGLSKEEIMVLVTGWNTKNRPPLSKAELETTVEYCYSRYRKEEAPGALPN
jgi:hypothetical protein